MLLFQAYAVLGCDSSSTDEEIKKAYRKLALQWHPDVYRGNDINGALRMTQIINEAKQVIEESRLSNHSVLFRATASSENNETSSQPSNEEETSDADDNFSWHFKDEPYYIFAKNANCKVPYDNFIWLNERDKFLDLIKTCFREEYFRTNRVLYSKIEEHLKHIKDKLGFVSVDVIFEGADYTEGPVSVSNLSTAFCGKKVKVERLFCSSQYGVFLESGDCIAVVSIPERQKPYLTSVIQPAIQHGLLSFERAVILRFHPFSLTFLFSFHNRRKINYDVVQKQIDSIEPTFRRIRQAWESFRYVDVTDIDRIINTSSVHTLYAASDENEANIPAPFVEYVISKRRRNEMRLLRFAAEDNILFAVLRELYLISVLFDYKEPDFWMPLSSEKTTWFKKTTDLLTVFLRVQIKRPKSKNAKLTVTVAVKISLNSPEE